MALSPLAPLVRAVCTQLMRSIKTVLAQHTSTNAGTSSSPGCPAPVRDVSVPQEKVPGMRGISDAHSNPSMLRISTPSLSADCLGVVSIGYDRFRA